MAQPKVVGITGTIGAGKSLIGNLLAARGYTVIDTDDVVHELFASDRDLQRAVIGRFGKGVVTDRGDINRTALGGIVFADDEARKDLEAIVHPAVVKECSRLIKQHLEEPAVFLLVPLLFEAGLEKHYDEIWTVITDDTVLKTRLKARTHLPDEELDKRIKAQMPQAAKAGRSQRVIDNTGSPAQTEEQVIAFLSQLASH